MLNIEWIKPTEPLRPDNMINVLNSPQIKAMNVIDKLHTHTSFLARVSASLSGALALDTDSETLISRPIKDEQPDDFGTSLFSL